MRWLARFSGRRLEQGELRSARRRHRVAADGMVKDYTPTCRYYCHGEKTCRRIDCMSCDGCNASAASIAHATHRIREYEQVNCSKTDGSFTLGASRWPAPYHFLDGGLAPLLLELIGQKTLLDVGAGSGQYGAWFESKRQHGAMNVPLWRGVDGVQPSVSSADKTAVLLGQSPGTWFSMEGASFGLARTRCARTGFFRNGLGPLRLVQKGRF